MSSNLTSTGSIAETAGLYKVSKRVPPCALKATRFKPQTIVATSLGAVKAAHLGAVHVRKLVPFRQRFVVQSLKRTLPKEIRGKLDMGQGASCPIRVIRKTIFVGRPEYQGAGVWA